MRLLYTLLFITFIAACQSEADKPKASFHLPFRKDSLVGNWMIISLTPISNNERVETLMEEAIAPMKEKIVLSAFSFQPNGKVVIDEGEVSTSSGNWLMNSTKQLLIQQKDSGSKAPLFNIMRYRNDSLTLENTIENRNDKLHIRYVLKRLRSNDSVPDLFNPALNKWRERPAHAEDDVAIKARMKQVLNYYGAYFANISGNRIPIFNIQKILCPIKFYSGGIGMKKFKEDDNWTNVFYNNQDAKKAHKMLDDAFSRLSGYPDRGGDYVQEYIAALKMVEDVL